MSIVTIIGSGMMGSAMSVPLRDNGHEVRLVGTPLDTALIERLRQDNYHFTMKRTLPDGIKYYTCDQIDEAVRGSDYFIGGVSSFGVEWFADEAVKHLPDNAIVLSITKGLRPTESGVPESFPEYLTRKTGRGIRFNAVGGPCISFELVDRQNTCVNFCGFDMATLENLRKLLSTDYYHIRCSTDVRGVETAVAMKNAYAAAVATAIGFNERTAGIGGAEKYNPQAGLFGQAVRETIKILQIAGADPDAIVLLAGDLYVTVFGGRTRKLGVLLGRGLSYAEAREELAGVTLESVAIAKVMAESLRALAAKGKANLDDFPLLLELDSVIHHGAKLDMPWKKFGADRC